MLYMSMIDLLCSMVGGRQSVYIGLVLRLSGVWQRRLHSGGNFASDGVAIALLGFIPICYPINAGHARVGSIVSEAAAEN